MKLYCLVLLCLLCFSCSKSDDETNTPKGNDSFVYIGLKDKAHLRNAQISAQEDFGRNYHPTLQIINGYIYSTTYSGIYRKKNDTDKTDDWELYGFKDVPVLQFVKNGNKVLAITANTLEKSILLSTDDGKTYKSVVPNEFIFDSFENKVLPFSIAQNPRNPENLLGLILPVGIVQSNDFGQSWEIIFDSNISGYQNWFVGFNPNDISNLYYTGESMVFESFIYSSFDGGKNWESIETVRNNCIHHIAFHPNDDNIMIYSGEYFLKKSTDKGGRWIEKLQDEIYFYKTIFDYNNPNIVYASGCSRNPKEVHKFKIYFSSDTGDNWKVLFETNLPGEGGVIDFVLYDKKLYLYTYTDGIYVLDINKALN